MLRRWMCWSLCWGLTSVAVIAQPTIAQDKKAGNWAALTEKDAGEDFALQGEYSGDLSGDSDAKKLGLQVIALGNGKFAAVAYPGGLPGDGWNRKDKFQGEGQADGGTLKFSNPEHGSVEIKGGKAAVFNKDKQAIGTLTKVLRKSPTLGQKAPEGAVVLFDGKDASHWQGGKVTDDGLLMEGTSSTDKFGSFTLHLEFMLSFMPNARGQGRANSGCYMQGRYETQILDSFGLEGKNNELGGVYSIKDPDLNMAFPPLSWQTYDVDFTAATFDSAGKKTANGRMTVLLNGVKVQDNIELTHATTASPLKEGPEPGPISLQNHGNPIRFRNIWVVPKK